MSLSYSTIAIGGAIAIGKQPNAYYNLDRFSTADKVLRTILLRTAHLYSQEGLALLLCREHSHLVAGCRLWLVHLAGPLGSYCA